MASASGCLHERKDFRLSDSSGTMGDPCEKSDVATASSMSGIDDAGPSTCYFSTVEEQIEESKAHWSMLVDHSDNTDEEEVDFEVSNKQEFEALQKHPKWGRFFSNFGGDALCMGSDSGGMGKLVVGKKFAEGGQGELYEAQIKWFDPHQDEVERQQGHDYVLKVFKEGTLLKDVKSQLPQGLLQFYFNLSENVTPATPKQIIGYAAPIYGGILLKDGRFAFIMKKLHFDLRVLIERNMKSRSGKDCGPFLKEDAQFTMYNIGLGVDWLHNHDIIHRDLKASNILIYIHKSGWPKWFCFVADYECSVGVVGTNFFRAPEVLQACKDKKVNERPEVFSRAADVYSYGMICYEILTGKLPFEGHPLSDSPSLLIDLVINQHLRPHIPTHVEDWARELLDGCWRFDPSKRLRLNEILDVLSINSGEVRRYEDLLKKSFGNKYRS